MFYLKYRPQIIEEIDTAQIREKLSAILGKGDLSHAWLFTGPKGTGKTSTARILAKAVNCDTNKFAQKDENIEPCNTCPNCRSIKDGNALDVIEMDAASNRKIDDIRALIEQVKFAPAHMRYKFYIIDEVHMLTQESFNALLKTLEEPPKSTIFVLATTELDKIPQTIVSRCLRISFPKASSGDVIRMLKRILKGEKKELTDEVLSEIAKHSDNSFRDAAKLLEESVLHNVSSQEGVKKLVGLADDNHVFLQLLDKGDLKNALSFIEEYDTKGGSIATLIEAVLDELHLILLAKNGLQTDETKTYSFTMTHIAALIKLLLQAYNTLKYSPLESLPLEVAVVDYLSEKK